MDDEKKNRSKELSDDQLNKAAGGRATVNSKKSVTLGYDDASTESSEDTGSINEATGPQLRKKKETENGFHVRILK